MLTSKIYTSKLPYQWEAGKHNNRKHQKAVKKHKRRVLRKSALGWNIRESR